MDINDEYKKLIDEYDFLILAHRKLLDSVPEKKQTLFLKKIDWLLDKRTELMRIRDYYED